MYKDIVVNLSLNPSRTATTSYAISVAQAFQAHLTGITFIYEPTPPLVYMDTSMPSRDIVFDREEAKRRADAAIEAFEDAARKADLVVDSRGIDIKTARDSIKFAETPRGLD